MGASRSLMFRSAVFRPALAILLLSAPTTAAARDYTTVLWDETHGTASRYTTTDKFSQIVAQLATEGYAVTVTTAGIDTLSLSNVGVIVLPVTSAYNTAYTTAEATILEAFVEDGGGVVIIGDNSSAWPENVNEIPAIWGVTTGTTYGVDTSITTFSTHAVTAGLSQLKVASAGDVTFTTEGEAVASTSTGTFIWVNEAGNGRVVVLGDINMWDNSRLTTYDDSLLATNVFDWVSWGQGAGYDVDADGYGPADDCDDTDGGVNPGATELCDGVDNDCDGTVDNDDAVGAWTWYADLDLDTYGDPVDAIVACDQPAGYVANDDDCKDTEPLSWTGATELCDGVDNDCDGTIDNDDAADAAIWYADADGDAYGDPTAFTTACAQPAGYVTSFDDCDDADPLAHLGAIEVCDGADNDCDGVADNDDAADALTWYADADGDTQGDGGTTTTACSLPAGYVENTGDCNDADALAWTGAPEVCDGSDNDCDGMVDNDSAADAAVWYLDADGDGYGDPTAVAYACARPAGYVANTDDCDDSEPLAYMGATERCDGVDNDCDGTVDNDSAVDAPIWYTDEDADGYGNPLFGIVSCTAPTDYVDNANDCNDAEALAWAGAPEVCDAVDNDCDGTIDNADALDALTWYADSDADTHGDSGSFVTACEAPLGYVDSADDCDDAEPLSWPGNTEVCDGVDNDCDGVTDPDTAVGAMEWYDDDDHDNYGDANERVVSCNQPTGHVADSADCNDGDDTVFPGAPDPAGDGIDQDCDGEGGEPVDSGDTADTSDTVDTADTAEDGEGRTPPGDTADLPGPDCGCASGSSSASALGVGVLLSAVLRRRQSRRRW